MTSFSHSEFKDLLITQRFTLCQMVDFLYNMDIYDTNMVYTSKIRIMMTHFEILRHHHPTKSNKITQLSITEPIYEIKL